MALTNFFACVSIERFGLTKKPFTKVSQHKHSHITIKNRPLLKIRSSSSFRNKVFEDRSEGIICYIDENGETICEGYDEGPRYHQKVHTSGSNLRDSEMLDLLQQRWFDFVRGSERNHVDNEKGVAVQGGDINCNGFNTLR